MTTFHSSRSPVGSTPSHGACVRRRDVGLLADALRPDHDVGQVEADVGERGQQLRVEPRRALVALPAVAGLDELVDAVGRERRDEPGQVARVLGDRVRLVELADLRVELGRDLAAVDLEDGRVGHARNLRDEQPYSIARRGPRPPLSRHVGVDADRAARAGGVPLRRGGEKLLFDCAEGTQRQLQRSIVGLPDLEEIFLTHLHADHFLGLPGMLKTFALRGREEPGLTVHGPSGLEGSLRASCGRSSAGCRIRSRLVELEPGETLERGEYRIEAFAVDHGVAGARLRARRARAARPLRRRRRRRARRAARPRARDPAGRRADHARRRPRDHARRGARAGRARAGRSCSPATPRRRRPSSRPRTRPTCSSTRRRSPPRRRSAPARRCTRRPPRRPRSRGSPRCALLALTHVSTRYFGPELAREAREIFPETVVPRDFDLIEVPFAERGAPARQDGARAVSSSGDDADGASGAGG